MGQMPSRAGTVRIARPDRLWTQWHRDMSMVYMRRQPIALRVGVATAIEPEDHVSGVAAARDSTTVAAWTIVSRVTGLVKFAVIGAVLGPTFFGNTYQFTNSLPNLLYYGLLAGLLFSPLLVPALVRAIDAHDHQSSERGAGGVLGITPGLLLGGAPPADPVGSHVVRFAALRGRAPAA